MEVMVKVTALWACLLPLHAQAPAAQDFFFRPEDLLGGSSLDLLRSSSNSQCSTPEGQQGVCGSASTCPHYLPLLDHLRNETVLSFFRERVCRYSPGVVHLCCPSSPEKQSSSIFLLELGKTPQASSGSFARPPQRSNARQPSRPGLGNDSDDENEKTEVFASTPSQPVSQPTPRSTVQLSIPAQGQPTASPQFPSEALIPTTPVTSTKVFLDSDKAPPVRVPFIPTTSAPLNQNQPPADLPVPPIVPTEGECGRPGSTEWVVGIGVLSKEEFRVKCGGALVTRQHVVTAAHCLENPVPSDVRLGDPLRQKGTEDVKLFTWTTAGYDPSTSENDLALVTLAKPITFTDNIRPVCLPFRYRFDGFRGQELQVVGWGNTGALETKGVKILGADPCRAAYNSPSLISNNVGFFSSSSSSSPSSPSSSDSSISSRISPRSSFSITVNNKNLCGSPAPSEFSSSCLSDFGAPIFFHDNETTKLHFLAGVSSFGAGCDAGPGLYTRLGAYIPWLSQELSKV